MGDYDDDELRRIFVEMAKHNSLHIEGGENGRHARLLAAQISRGRGQAGFGNAHTLNAAYREALYRWVARIRKSNREGSAATDEKVLTKEDIIGPRPRDVRNESKAWKELQSMAGLGDVKTAARNIFERVRTNQQRELSGERPLETSLNRVFMGPPGTGKTTVAKLYGQIVADAGLLSTQEVEVKTPSDFIAYYIGESGSKTNAILDSTRGKVLIIDDTHMFYPVNRADISKQPDDCRIGRIDVLVSKIRNQPGEDRCVTLVGYPDLLEEMSRNCNPGLRRRFPLEEAFQFSDYDNKRLREILQLKTKAYQITCTEAATNVAVEVLRRARDRPDFGNGGDVVNLLSQAKIRYHKRILKQKNGRIIGLTSKKYDNDSVTGKQDDTGLKVHAARGSRYSSLGLEEMTGTCLEPRDFDPNYDRGATASERCRTLFNGLHGFEGIIQRFEECQREAENLGLSSKNPKESIPSTCVFKGPPGTGKTRTARISGQIFYGMGFLSTNEVIECSATDLIGQYIGRTGPKVIEFFERALGKVFFIDEAYRLGPTRRGERGSFTEDAVGELFDCITKPRYQRKMVIILAGYTQDIDQLMEVNAGLRGRFATEIEFPPLGVRASTYHLQNTIRKKDIALTRGDDSDETETKQITRLLMKLSMTRGWSNTRDIETLADIIVANMHKNKDVARRRQMDEMLELTNSTLIMHLKYMLRQRTGGGRN
ncbi:P-loop containing nucleoside triphosphate hydrolase protein [Durotheca rogersii]|uniref:P-loop containing nucleoside triphosphate hydrolase protein n=1 Tax=Durotheca rogersii TaxID=419775 RepID=UPI00221EAF99|nr:P-loop containing nucleoside triphosphate hydrolase protein [Durotheca rogersii]KAI5859878.1 P-loop containing nucleoside triphosphate hydrolase protein [Durotheca rogersii]